MRYYLNTNMQLNGDYEVHIGTCSWLPNEENRLDLGDYDSCKIAVLVAALRGYSQANGCYYCCNECHTT